MEYPALVSVIIPLYNREKYIRTTLNSILNQTYQNVEIIVVDDGSTDKSIEALTPILDKITLLQHPGQVNKGQSAAINLGIKNSSGKYICILDSDDLFLPDKLRVQVEFLENNHEIGLVYGNGDVVDSKGKKLWDFYSEPVVEASDPCKVLMNCYFLLPNNAMFRRKLIDKVGYFDEDLRSGQDHDMAIRIAEVTKMAYIDKKIFNYRKHSDSISMKNADLRWRNGFIILNKARKRYRYPLRIIRKRRAVLHFRLGQVYIENKQYLKSGFHFLAAGALDPYRGIKVIFKKESTGGLH